MSDSRPSSPVRKLLLGTVAFAIAYLLLRGVGLWVAQQEPTYDELVRARRAAYEREAERSRRSRPPNRLAEGQASPSKEKTLDERLSRVRAVNAMMLVSARRRAMEAVDRFRAEGGRNSVRLSDSAYVAGITGEMFLCSSDDVMPVDLKQPGTRSYVVMLKTFGEFGFTHWWSEGSLSLLGSVEGTYEIDRAAQTIRFHVQDRHSDWPRVADNFVAQCRVAENGMAACFWFPQLDGTGEVVYCSEGFFKE